jgi:glycosidase
MQMTYVGAPMVYYGDEVGMWGGNDPDCRKPMVWEDIEYKAEVHGPQGTLHDADIVEVNRELINHYKKLIHIRNENPELQTGEYRTWLTDDDRGLFGFERVLPGSRILIVINNSSDKLSVTLPGMTEACLRDLISGKEFSTNVVEIPGQLYSLTFVKRFLRFSWMISLFTELLLMIA